MTTACTLDIAGFSIGLTSDDDLPITVEGSARKFVGTSDARTADVRIHTRWGEPAAETGAPLFDSGKGLWRVYATTEGARFVFTSPALGELPYQAATFNRDYSRGEVALRRSTFGARVPVYPLHYPLDEVFMVHLLARGWGVEIHGSGVVTADGRGFLFAGHSGAGKTTFSRLWLAEPGATVLSDERIILRKEQGAIWMYGTPWHGDGHIATPGRCRLDHVFILRHGARNELVNLPRAQAAARLFTCGFTPFHDAEGLDFSLGFLGEIGATCPCDELHFLPDRGAVDFVLAR